MAVKPRPKQLRAHQAKRSQERSDRTRALVIAETINCIRDEGFASASTRRIIARAGVTWGVIQYHFGDRDGLLAAVIDYSYGTLIDSLDSLADQSSKVTDFRARAASLTAGAWEIFFTPTSVTAFEILLATRGSLDAKQRANLAKALNRVAALIEGPTPHATAIANLLWASPVGMMMAQRVNTVARPTEGEQRALADLIADHVQLQRDSKQTRKRPTRARRT
jgi:AcrR family transcriptional regulator